MHYALIFSTILALLGCPLRCAVGQTYGEASSANPESLESQANPASGCKCCLHHSPPSPCEPSSSDAGDSDSLPRGPAPDDCDCLCLCKGAVVEKQSDLPQMDEFEAFLPLLAVDKLPSALRCRSDSARREMWPKSRSAPSGRLIRFAVQSLLI